MGLTGGELSFGALPHDDLVELSVHPQRVKWSHLSSSGGTVVHDGAVVDGSHTAC